MSGRAVLFPGSGEALETVRLAPPDPAAGEIRVRVLACSICRSDLNAYRGRVSQLTPCILGHEVIGRIDAFGRKTSRHDIRGAAASVGDRIVWSNVVSCGACFFCRHDLPQKCERLTDYGHERFEPDRPAGGLADWVLLRPETAWIKVPRQVPDGVATLANCPVATAAAVLRSAGAVEGAAVLILGAGALGLSAAAVTSFLGAESVIVSEPDPRCRERAPRFGATRVLGTGSYELAAGVAEATDGRGADVVLELAGAAGLLERSISLVRTGGTVVLAGGLAPTPPACLSSETVVREMLTIRGVHRYQPRDLAVAVDLLAAGRYPFSSLLGGRYSLEEPERAFAAAEARPGVRVRVETSEGADSRSG